MDWPVCKLQDQVQDCKFVLTEFTPPEWQNIFSTSNFKKLFTFTNGHLLLFALLLVQKKRLLSPLKFDCVKGQIISKGLFGVLDFSQKTNERIRRSSKNKFVRSFFGKIRGYQKSFQIYLTFWQVVNNGQNLVQRPPKDSLIYKP